MKIKWKKKDKKILDSAYANGYWMMQYIIDRSKSKLFYNKKKEEIIEIIPKFIAHTNKKNRFWMKCLFPLASDQDILNAIINSISKVQIEEEEFVYNDILYMMEINNLTEKQLQTAMNQFLDCHFVLDYSIVKNIYNLIQKKNPNLTHEVLEKLLKNENTCDATIQLIVKQGNIDLLYKNFDYILKNNKNIDLFYIKEIVANNEEEVVKVKKIIKEDEEAYVARMIKRLYGEFYHIKNLSFNEKKKFHTILEVIYLVIKDICKNEHVDVSDITYLGKGAYSSVLAIGDKVLKVGCQRGTNTFPNNPYINIPLIRKEFIVKIGMPLVLEVNEKVDTNSKISEEEMYQLYKKLRKIGLIMVDISKNNFGRLTKKNIIHWREKLPSIDAALGLQSYRGEEILKEGDIVILDNDFIFEDTTPERIYRWATNDLQKKFETRYQNEIKKERNKKNL